MPPTPPSRLTPDRHTTIVELVATGTAAFRAAMATGVSERTWWRWVARAREIAEQHGTEPEDLNPDTLTEYSEHDRNCVRIWQDTQAASAQCEAEQLARIQTAAKHPQTWQAAAWMLERLWPERYLKRVEVSSRGSLVEPSEIVKAAEENVVRLDPSRRSKGA